MEFLFSWSFWVEYIIIFTNYHFSSGISFHELNIDFLPLVHFNFFFQHKIYLDISFDWKTLLINEQKKSPNDLLKSFFFFIELNITNLYSLPSGKIYLKRGHFKVIYLFPEIRTYSWTNISYGIYFFNLQSTR